jgi:uncharacterized protein (DUF697 family)
MSTYEYGVQEYGQQEFEEESGYQGEYEGEGEFAPSQEGPFGETPYGEYGGYQGEFEEEFGVAQEAPFGEMGQQGEYEGPLNEAEEINLASELLEVSDEEELEQFLGNLFKKVSKGVGGFLRSGVGRSLGGILKNVAKTALPVVGGAIGSFVAPGIGTALGSKLGSMASGLFEVELEGMDREEQEFEVARRFVRLAATSARNASLAPRGGDPLSVARRSVLAASRRHAPGVARRFRRFARPAPWYWPYPMPYGGMAAGYGSGPDGSGAAQGGYGGGPGGYDDGEPEPLGEPMGGPGEMQPGGMQPGAMAPGGMPPGGMPPGGTNGNGSRPRSGRWIMRGRRLIVLGI